MPNYPFFKKRVPIYKLLYEEFINKIIVLLDDISAEEEPQDIFEDFLMYMYKTNIAFIPEHKDQVNLLRFIRLIKHVVENEIVASLLKTVCEKSKISYQELRDHKGEIFYKIESERTHIYNLICLHSDSSKEPPTYPLFEEADLVFEYSEWRQIAPKQELFAQKMNSLKEGLWSRKDVIEKISHETFKEIYYIYYAIYESYFAHSIIKDGKEKYPTLYLKENEGILRCLQEIEKSLTCQTDKPYSQPQLQKPCEQPMTATQTIKQDKNTKLFFATPDGFEYEYKIKKLAELLADNKYISQESISTFVSIFFYNEETKKANRTIIWYKDFHSLNSLFSKLYLGYIPLGDTKKGKKVPRYTWQKVLEVFRDYNNSIVEYKTFVGTSRKKHIAKSSIAEIEKIENIVDKAKMYKEA